MLLTLHLRIDELLGSIDGQDMDGYAHVLGMLSFGITAASTFLSAALATAFKGIWTTVGSYVS